MVAARFLSDSFKLFGDPAQIAEANETANELFRILGGATLEDIEAMNSDEIWWLRTTLAEAGFMPKGRMREPAQPRTAAELVGEQRKSAKQLEKQRLLMEATAAQIQERIERGWKVGGSANRGKSRGKRLTRHQRKEIGFIRPLEYEVKPSRLVIKKRTGVFGDLNCPKCGFSDGIRQIHRGYVCVGCGWGKEISMHGVWGKGGMDSSRWRASAKNPCRSSVPVPTV